jgi:hypothetical protein
VDWFCDMAQRPSMIFREAGEAPERQEEKLKLKEGCQDG